jgi:pimeloyl-ACP methyl ester carboxylesterase
MPTTLRFAGHDGLALAADSWGADPHAPVVVFLHGGGQTRHAWGSTAQRTAAAGFRSISVDQRGHGDSGWAQGGRYEAEHFAADVLAITSQLGRPPVVVGASLGGIAALLAEGSLSSGGLLAGLVLVDITPRMAPAGIGRILAFMRARPDGFESLEEAADTIAAYLPHRPRPTDLSGLEKNLRPTPDGRYRWHWDPSLMEVWNPAIFTEERRIRVITDRLLAAASLRCPTMLVRGRHSTVVSPEAAAEFLEACPQAEFVDLEGAQHMVAGDRNDAFTTAVLGFLNRNRSEL